MLLFDILDYLIYSIFRLVPFIITMISIILAYYYYKKYSLEKFESKTTNDKIKLLYKSNPDLFDKKLFDKFIKNKNIKKEYNNYFCTRDCKLNNNKCQFKIENTYFDCPNIICKNKDICKNKSKLFFDNKNFLNNKDNMNNITRNESFLNKNNITTKKNRIDNNYYCFDGEKCISKQYLEPSKTSCGNPSISQYPNKIYTSEDECYKENLFYKILDKKTCIRLPHGYGWLEGKGCIKGSPIGPHNLNLNFSLYSDDKIKYTASNPDAFILPKHNFHYTNLI